MSTTPFVAFLEQLQDQAAQLGSQWMPVESAEHQPAQEHLRVVYHHESTNYPYQVPPFDPKAALWAAALTYHTAQLVFHRQQVISEVEQYFKPYSGAIHAAAVLSADLSLRFLPSLLDQLQALNADDYLVDLLLGILTPWHYSLVGSAWRQPIATDWTALERDACLRQLYADRVIAAEDLELAAVPILYRAIEASLGDYGSQIWPSFGVVQPHLD